MIPVCWQFGQRCRYFRQNIVDKSPSDKISAHLRHSAKSTERLQHKKTIKHTKSKKGKGRTLVIVHSSRQSQGRGAQVHGVHRAASHIPALYLSSRSRYSFTDHERMEGWVNPGPGCKQQLAHGCYVTAWGQRDSNPDLTIVSRAR